MARFRNYDERSGDAGRAQHAPTPYNPRAGGTPWWLWLIPICVILTFFYNTESKVVEDWENQHGEAPLIVAAPLPPPVLGINAGDNVIVVSPLSEVLGTGDETLCHELIHSEQFRRGMSIEQREQLEAEAYARQQECVERLRKQRE